MSRRGGDLIDLDFRYVPIPEVDTETVVLRPPGRSEDKLVFTATDQGITYTVNGGDPRPPIKRMVFDGIDDLDFPDIKKGMVLPVDESLPRLLGGLKCLAAKAGVEHNISCEVKMRGARKAPKRSLERSPSPRRKRIPVPEVDVTEVRFVPPGRSDELIFTPSDAGVIYTVNGKDPRPPTRTVIFDGIDDLDFPDINKGAVLPRNENLAEILGGIRALCRRSRAVHNIPEEIYEPSPSPPPTSRSPSPERATPPPGSPPVSPKKKKAKVAAEEEAGDVIDLDNMSDESLNGAPAEISPEPDDPLRRVPLYTVTDPSGAPVDDSLNQLHVTVGDYDCLSPLNMLSSKILNFYLLQYLAKGKSIPEGGDKVLNLDGVVILPTLWYTTLKRLCAAVAEKKSGAYEDLRLFVTEGLVPLSESGKKRTTPEPKQLPPQQSRGTTSNRAKMWGGEIAGEIFKSRLVLIPIHAPEKRHWAMAVIANACHYDSRVPPSRTVVARQGTMVMAPNYPAASHPAIAVLDSLNEGIQKGPKFNERRANAYKDVFDSLTDFLVVRAFTESQAMGDRLPQDIMATRVSNPPETRRLLAQHFGVHFLRHLAPVPSQKNGVDCGVHVLVMCTRLLQEAPSQWKETDTLVGMRWFDSRVAVNEMRGGLKAVLKDIATDEAKKLIDEVDARHPPPIL